MSRHARGDQDVAGVIAPPPLIYLGFLLLGFAFGRFWPLDIPGDWLAPVPRIVVGLALVALGIAVARLGFRQFHKAGTAVRPDHTTTALVTDGIYRYSRNPLYISLTLIYAGIAVTANSLWTLAFLVPTLAIIRYGVIAREEAYLERKFGEDYRRFKTTVRRWL